MGKRILDVRIRNPGKHFAALRKHLLACGIEVGKNLNGYAGSANERRNCLYNLLVFIHLLLRAEFLAGRNEFPNFRIFGNESWMGCLTVDVPDQCPDLSSLCRITTINQALCSWPSSC